MLVFSFGKRTYKDRGPGTAATCPSCGRFGRLLLLEERSWFTLFFVPVIPYSNQYVESCPSCGYQRILTKQAFEEALRSAEADRASILG